MIDGILERIERTETQTLGVLSIYDEGELVYTCKTLELEEDKNAVRDDCIPLGDYTVIKRWSQKYKDHFHILDVPNRSYILIHSANYSRQLLGCIAVGQNHTDIDGDGLKDVTSSKRTMRDLNRIITEDFQLQIV